MIKKPVTVRLKREVENRPAAMLVQVASQYRSEVYLEVEENKRINAKSIMGMMTLGLDSGDKVVLSVNGEDESEAAQELEAYLTNKK